MTKIRLTRILILSILLFFSSYTNAYVSAQDTRRIYKELIRVNKFKFYAALRFENTSSVEAYGTGDTITITRGMLRAVRNKHEMTFILGHEIAHINLFHIQSNYRNEYAADRLGKRYAAKAGYDMCKGTKLLLRFGGRSRSHPSGQERYQRVGCGK